MSEEKIRKELGSLSGVYIPGDSKESFENEEFLDAVRTIISFVSEENLQEEKHFPLVTVSWGMLSLLKCQLEQSRTELFRGL